MLNQDKITRIIEKSATKIVKYRWLLIPLIVVMAIISTYGLTHLKTSTSIQNLFVKDDPVILAQKEFDSIFGNSDFIGILVEAEDIFSSESLSLIDGLAKNIQKDVPWISGASSILGFSEKKPEDMTQEDIEKLRTRLDKRDNIRSVLYSEDYKQGWILFSLETYPEANDSIDSEGASFIVGHEVMNVINSYRDNGYTVYATGVPVLEYRKSNELTADLIRVVIIATISVIVLVVFLTRSFACTLGSVLVTAMTILSVFGILGWFGQRVDTTFMLVPILLTIAVSIGYSIHVFNMFRLNMIKDGKRKDAVVTALTDTGWPIFFTALTTIVALLSFIVVPIGAIQWVGLTSAASLIVVYLLTMVFFAPLLSVGKDHILEDNVKFTQRTEKILEKLSRFVLAHKRPIVIIYVVIIVVAAFGLSKVRVDIKAMEMMGQKMPHIQDQSHIANSSIGINYSYSIALIFSGENEALDPVILNKVDELVDYIYETPYIKRVTSVNDIIKEVNQIRHRDNFEHYVIPEKASLIKGLITYTRRLSDDSLKLLIDEENRVLRILVEMNEVSTSAMVGHIDGVNHMIAELFPSTDHKDFKHLLVGSVIQLSEMNQYITVGLIRSVVTALLVISLMMMIVFRSVKLGLISMIPNISPVIVAGGVMGIMGEPLEFVTMTIAPMIIGLAVDDTIHFINHVRVDFAENGNYDLAIRNSFTRVGKAMTQATLILCTTFLMFTTSIAHSMFNMGIYINIGMITALVADFTITPILIKRSKPFGKEL